MQDRLLMIHKIFMKKLAAAVVIAYKKCQLSSDFQLLFEYFFAFKIHNSFSTLLAISILLLLLLKKIGSVRQSNTMVDETNEIFRMRFETIKNRWKLP